MGPALRPNVTTEFVQPQEDELSLACHKLRTPLTAAMGFLQLARRDAARVGSAPSGHLEMVDQQLRRLSGMLDELAAKSRLQ